MAPFAKSLDSELERLDQLLSRQENRVRAAFAEFVRDVRSEAVVKQVVDLLAKGDIDGAMGVIGPYVNRMAAVFPTVYQQAGQTELVAIAEQLAPIVPVAAVSFNPTDPRAAMVIRQATLEFIQRFTEGQREATRMALATGLENGQSYDAMARAFRGSVGLTPAQEQAVKSYRAGLESGSRTVLDRALRDRRFDPSAERAASGGAPLSPDQIDRMTDRYRDRSVATRADTIARTEAARAVSEARQLAFEQNLAASGISTDAATQVWRAIRDNRTRDTHVVLNGQEQPFGRAFQSPSGAALRYPGDPAAPAAEIINCRCHLTFKIDANKVQIAA